MNEHDAVDLDEDARAQVLPLLAAAAGADGSEPLSEAGVLALRHRHEGVRHLGVVVDHVLVGYAQVAVSGDSRGSVEGCVHPEHRLRGVGTGLARAVTSVLPGQALAWAHGDHPGAAALAARLGAERARELWQMRRPLSPDDASDVGVPPGVRVRPFVPGQDEDAWLAVNAAAFAHHPEQGATTLADLREREQEPWFDPAGFLLAVDEADDVLGFHWTKVHPATAVAPPAGEVYVIGVAPRAQGRRLGGVLLRAGLDHLARHRTTQGEPLAEVLLYVEADNAPAVGLYRSRGFEVAHVDVQYRWGTRS